MKLHKQWRAYKNVQEMGLKPRSNDREQTLKVGQPSQISY